VSALIEDRDSMEGYVGGFRFATGLEETLGVVQTLLTLWLPVHFGMMMGPSDSSSQVLI
jgi:hypothetical protein